MSRIHANNFTTTLNGSIDASQTSVILNSVTGFPTIGAGVTANITVQNGSSIEIMTATARSSFTLTVTRGVEGTTGTAFANTSTVEIRPTADSVDRKVDTADFTDALISTSDITTNNATTAKHGFLKKLSNVSTEYMSGTGVWSTPAGGSSFTWSEVTGTTQAASVSNGYVLNNAAQVNVTLPATAAIGDKVSLVGKGAGGWKVTANTGQTINIGSVATSSAGAAASANRYDTIEVVCITANTTWSMTSSVSAGFTIT